MSGRGMVGIGVAVGAAVYWAVGMALLQPWTEPSGPEAYAENNTYWVRDLRVAAIITVVLGLLVALDGARPAVVPVAALGGLWLAADVAVDRADVSGPVPAVVLGLVASAAVAATALVLTRRPVPDGGRPGHRTLVVAAAVAAALTPWAAGMQSPSDTEPELHLAAVALGLLLVATCAAATRAAARAGSATLDADRAGAAGRAGSVAAGPVGTVVLAVVGGAGVFLLRVIDPYQRTGPMILLGTLLLVGVVLLAALPSGGWSRPATLLVVLLGHPLLAMAVAIVLTFIVPIGAWLTALVGSTPVNSADSDSLFAVAGLITGLVFGTLLTAVTADRRPAPTPAHT